MSYNWKIKISSPESKNKKTENLLKLNPFIKYIGSKSDSETNKKLTKKIVKWLKES